MRPHPAAHPHQPLIRKYAPPPPGFLVCLRETKKSVKNKLNSRDCPVLACVAGARGRRLKGKGKGLLGKGVLGAREIAP